MENKEYWDEKSNITCIEKIKKCDNLNDLFEIWKKAQIYEKNPYISGKIVENDYFTIDGYINKEKYDKARKKILFILKESHIAEKRQSSEDNQINWYNNYLDWLNDRNTRRLPDYSYIREDIARISAYILNKEHTYNINDLKDALESIACMNINKRGGTGSCDNLKLYELYYKKYKEYVLREIEICNPQIIISMCGKEIFDDLKLKLEKENIKLLSIEHPSRGMYIKIDDEEVNCGFLEITKGIKIKSNSIEDKMNFYNNKMKNDSDLKFNKTTFKYLMKFIKKYNDM